MLTPAQYKAMLSRTGHEKQLQHIEDCHASFDAALWTAMHRVSKSGLRGSILLPEIWPSSPSHRSISWHIDRMFRIGFVLLRRPELTVWLIRLPRAGVLITIVGIAQCKAFVLILATAATTHRQKRRIAAYPLLITGRLHSWRRGIATKPTMLTGHGLRFHPIVRHHVPLSCVVAGMGGRPPRALCWCIPQMIALCSWASFT
jgi:hypothetical protein